MKQHKLPLPALIAILLVCLALLAGLALGVYHLATRVYLQTEGVGSRAVVLDARWNSWFLSPCNPTEMQAHIDEALDGIQAMGGDTVLWSARTSDGAFLLRGKEKDGVVTAKNVLANDSWKSKFDPLKYMVEACNERSLRLALIATDDAGAAISYEALDAGADSTLTAGIRRAAKTYGLLLCAQYADSTPAPAAEGEAVYYNVADHYMSYWYYSVAGGSQLVASVGAVDTAQTASLLAAYASTGGQFADHLLLGKYTDLTEELGDQVTLLRSWLADSEPLDLYSNFAGESAEPLQSLSLGYPQDNATVYTDTLFLMGTSDPAQELQITGGSIEGVLDVPRYGTKGVWGYLVSLQQGENTFVLGQGETKKVFTVVRGAWVGGSGSSGAIGSDGSLPAEDGQYLQITATIAGAMSDYSNNDSICATLPQGSVAQVMGSVRFVRSGKYTYAYKLASGNYILAQNCILLPMDEVEQVLEVSDDSQTSDDDEHSAETTGGTSAADAQKNQVSNKLLVPMQTAPVSSGKPAAEPETETILVSSVSDAAFTGVRLSTDDATRCTVLTFEGSGTPVIYPSWEEDVLRLTFYSAGFTGQLPAPEGVIKDWTLYPNDEGTAFTLTMATADLWGWNSEFVDGTTKIYLKQAPTVTDESAPLTGVTVLLDPGHGGDDDGAMGSAGTGYPCEKDVNMAEALAAKTRLEQLGATVVLTRTDDSTMTLNERLEMLNATRPDFFIALHHNSMDLSNDVNNSRGVECYWFYTEGEGLAQRLTDHLTQATGRKLRGVYYDYYYVTRSNICPAVLLESGFMTNPGEYESVTDSTTLWAEGGAVAQSVLECVRYGLGAEER